MPIDFATDPSRYRHWRLEFDGPVASLILDVDPTGGLFPGTELKLNSYDLGVYIELADAVMRLRFAHPEISAVVIRSGKDNVFCAGANIGALARASHAHKVNFCKFSNETLLALEEASAESGQHYIAALSGTAAGGGYELALACEHIMLIDDRRSAVSLPEVPLLAVLPGTGGLTRLTDKRRVRRDLADVFCTAEEGVRGQRALDWRLVDQLVPPSAWEDEVRERALALAVSPHPNPPPLAGEGAIPQVLQNPPPQAGEAPLLTPPPQAGEVPLLTPPPQAGEGGVGAVSAFSLAGRRFRVVPAPRSTEGPDASVPVEGIALPALDRKLSEDRIEYRHVRVTLDRERRLAGISIQGPTKVPDGLDAIHAQGAAFWPLAMARELDDAILHLRFNEPALGVIVFRSEGDPNTVLAYDWLLESNSEDWFVREVTLLLKRVFKRIDLTSRSLFTLIEPGSCFAGTLAELVFAADRALMFAGARSGDDHGPAALALSPLLNFAAYPMSNGLSRLATRFLGEPGGQHLADKALAEPLLAEQAKELGLVTAAYDAVDWDEEVRLMLEERASFSPDALTGLEANLRFAGPETMETKIFSRLSAWQNWIFQRPNATGDNGALKRYGTGQRPEFDPERV